MTGVLKRPHIGIGVESPGGKLAGLIEDIADEVYGIGSAAETEPTIKPDVTASFGIRSEGKPAYLPRRVVSEIHVVLSKAEFCNLADGVMPTCPIPP
jgi:hypothetical protein